MPAARPTTLLPLLLALTATLAGCGGGGGPLNTGGPGTATVTITGDPGAPGGSVFENRTVRAGTIITWQNASAAPHNVVWDARTPGNAPDPGANLPVFASGATSAAWVAPAVTTDTTYAYHCGLHPAMLGVITVTP